MYTQNNLCFDPERGFATFRNYMSIACFKVGTVLKMNCNELTILLLKQNYYCTFNTQSS
jgi:hypothetical protein